MPFHRGSAKVVAGLGTHDGARLGGGSLAAKMAHSYGSDHHHHFNTSTLLSHDIS
jgi:hypothetical protein